MRHAYEVKSSNIHDILSVLNLDIFFNYFRTIKNIIS